MAGLKKTTQQIDETKDVIREIENENMRNFSDISVSEDEFVHDVSMLAGYVDEDGIVHQTFTFREMNGRDEEAINKSDVRSNGAKVINIIVERCVVSIGTLNKNDVGIVQWSKIIRNLLTGDLDYMAFKIRELSKGKNIEFKHTCPNCSSKLVSSVSTDDIGIKPFMGQYTIPFVLNKGYKDPKGGIHKEGVLRLPNGYDRELMLPIAKKNGSTAMSFLLTRLISFSDGALITQECIKDLTLKDREILENSLRDNDFGLDTFLELTCENCGEDLSGDVGQSNFF